jgi:hypothetical protein
MDAIFENPDVVLDTSTMSSEAVDLYESIKTLRLLLNRNIPEVPSSMTEDARSKLWG